MIPNVVRGGRTRGVLEYLIGRGRRDEHVEPRLVAGSPQALVIADAEGVGAGEQGRELERRDAGELAAFLDEPRERSGTTVRVPSAMSSAASLATATRMCGIARCRCTPRSSIFRMRAGS